MHVQSWTVRHHWLQVCKPKQNANEGCNSCASLAGLVLCFIACFILLVIAALVARVSVVRVLGIYLDSDTSVSSEVAKTASSCFSI